MQAKRGARAERIDRTKQQLIDVGRRSFMAKGFEATTVDELCAEVGVSQRTFFRYFASKEAVLFEGDRDFLPPFVEAIKMHAPSDITPQTIGDAMLTLADVYLAGEDFFLFRTQLGGRNARVASYFQMLYRERELELAEILRDYLGATPDDIRPRMLAGIATTTLRIAIERWAACDGSTPLPVLVREAFGALDEMLPQGRSVSA